MALSRLLRYRISKVLGAGMTIAAAGILAFSGLVQVGALDSSTYDCGTYGGGTYDTGDCSDAATSAGSGNSTTPSASSSTDNGQILLNDFAEYTSPTGKSLSLKKGDIVYFNLAAEKHTITVKDFDAGNVTVTIASTPTDVFIPIGQTTSYDVDQDGTPDIAITYDQIASDNGSVTATFRALTSSTPTSSNTSSGASGTSTGGTSAGTEKTANLWWVWIIPIIVGIVLLTWAIIAAQKRRKNNSSSTGKTFQY